MENFKKLSVTEKKDLIEEIYEKDLTLHFKFENSTVYKVKLIRGRKSSLLTFRRPANLEGVFHRRMATIIIPIGEERYFFSSKTLIDSKSVHFNMENDFFHLRRRKVRRITIPSVYPVFLMIKKVHGTSSFLKAVVLDLSDGGMKVGLNSKQPLIKINQEIVGTLRIGTRRGIEVRTRVRHHKKEEQASLMQVFGLEITEISDYSKAMYSNQLLDFQRDLFTIFMNKTGADFS
ncbi:MAG: PilZ domain-containing protein [Bdellovibrionota bacterium]